MRKNAVCTHTHTHTHHHTHVDRQQLVYVVKLKCQVSVISPCRHLIKSVSPFYLPVHPSFLSLPLVVVCPLDFYWMCGLLMSPCGFTFFSLLTLFSFFFLTKGKTILAYISRGKLRRSKCKKELPGEKNKKTSPHPNIGWKLLTCRPNTTSSYRCRRLEKTADKGTSVLTKEDPSHCCCSASQFINLTDVSVPLDLLLSTLEFEVWRDWDVSEINKLWCWATAVRGNLPSDACSRLHFTLCRYLLLD